MRTAKVMRRLARIGECPEVLNTVARDAGVALARGERDALLAMVRELAARAPGGEGDPPPDRPAQDHYWAGFAAAMGVVLAAYEAEHGQADARAAALGALHSPAARRVLAELAHGPATGAALAGRLQLSRGGISKILKGLRGAGLARVAAAPAAEASAALQRGAAGTGRPERGAPKPHVLTARGAAMADELAAERQPGSESAHAPSRRRAQSTGRG